MDILLVFQISTLCYGSNSLYFIFCTGNYILVLMYILLIECNFNILLYVINMK